MLQAFYPSIGPICPVIVHNENKIIGMVEETICAPPIGHNLARPPLGVCCCWEGGVLGAWGSQVHLWGAPHHVGELGKSILHRQGKGSREQHYHICRQ